MMNQQEMLKWLAPGMVFEEIFPNEHKEYNHWLLCHCIKRESVWYLMNIKTFTFYYTSKGSFQFTSNALRFLLKQNQWKLIDKNVVCMLRDFTKLQASTSFSFECDAIVGRKEIQVIVTSPVLPVELHLDFLRSDYEQWVVRKTALLFAVMDAENPNQQEDEHHSPVIDWQKYYHSEEFREDIKLYVTIRKR